ncbi:MAG TPA: DUF742 domain-containing protein [Streptosporangiaceae bacterium]
MDSEDDDRWMDWDSGPVARPYMVTGGRTRPAAPAAEEHLDLIDMVARSGKAADTFSFSPERTQILDLCCHPVTVADLASAIGLPVGVVRVLLGDLLNEGLIDVKRMAARGTLTDKRLLRQVLDGLNAL